MDEVWARVGLVAAALLVAGAVVIWRRKPARGPARDVSSGDLRPGVYFFSSSSCPTCSQARDDLDQALARGYTEVSWEEQPGLFSNLGVDAVPAVLVVKAPGMGRLYPGRPDEVLAEL